MEKATNTSMRGDKKPNSTMKMHKDKLTTSFGPATSDNHCICMRPRENIICTNCGQTGFARIMLVCPMHPERKYLCDWSRCPNCKGSLFREYR